MTSDTDVFHPTREQIREWDVEDARERLNGVNASGIA